MTITYPVPYSAQKPYPIRLRTKTSFTAPKSKIALVILFWLGSKPTGVVPFIVSKELTGEEGDPGAQFDSSLVNDLVGRVSNLLPQIQVDQLRVAIQDHPLLKDQLEPMQMGISYLWKLAEITFSEPRPNSAERKGGQRFPKNISYSSAIDLISALADLDESAVLRTLITWALPGLNIEPSTVAEKALTRVLTHSSERSLFMLKLNGDDFIFTQPGILDRLGGGVPSVDIKTDDELMGSTRILRPLLADGLNLYAEVSNGRATLSSHAGTADAAKAYVGRARLYESLFNSEDVNAKNEIQEENIQTGVEATFPRNRVVVGAPGTGKSYRLDEDALSVGAEVTRTVFHSATSFTQFFGSLRPMSSKDDEREVAFKFIPGPFIRTLVAALRQPSRAQVLLIEELNRADAAAVFGDVFQLLDRDMIGSSSYSISVSTECRAYLERELPGYDFNSIRIPANFWIWCTLNPADQGVGHLDAAFLRRWTREYVSIDAGSEAVSHHILRLPQHSLTIPWNGFRIRLNELLSTKLERKIPEDRLLGPFFFTPAEFGSANHDFLFCDKLLNYVADDILRHSKSDFFGSPKLATFSNIRSDYFSTDHSLIRSWLAANFDSLIAPMQPIDSFLPDTQEPTPEKDV